MPWHTEEVEMRTQASLYTVIECTPASYPTIEGAIQNRALRDAANISNVRPDVVTCTEATVIAHKV